MNVTRKEIEIDYDFQGGLTLSASGLKNGLLAAIDLGLISKTDASEVLLLVREATQRLLQDMRD